MKLRILLPVLAALILSGCAGFSVGPNTATGIAIGAIGGAVIDRGNPARGAIIGGGVGGVIGGIADEDARHRHEDQWHRHDHRRHEEWRRREEWRRWQHYCQHNWRRDYRCRY